MSRPPLVSIGLPTYNRAASLKRAIESVLIQDYQNIELLISDNASTDETQAICLAACQRDDRVKYVRQPKNHGVSTNFQEVLDRARGEFFMWLADDDWLGQETYVAACVKILSASPAHALVCGRARYYDDEQLVLEERGISLLDDSGPKRVLAYYAQVSGNGVFYGLMRREHLLHILQRKIFGGDWLMIAEIAFVGKVETLDKVSLNRSIKGMSRDLEKLALDLGTSWLMAQSPHLKVAASAWADVVWKTPLYRALSLPARLILGSRSFITICKHCIIPYWYGQAYAYVNREHPRFRRVAKTLKDRLTTS